MDDSFFFVILHFLSGYLLADVNFISFNLISRVESPLAQTMGNSPDMSCLGLLIQTRQSQSSLLHIGHIIYS
jgi:hypothetical protein